jgi:hypothetical protein
LPLLGPLQYVNNAITMPAYSPLLLTLVNFYESMNTLNMTQQLPKGWKSGNYSTTGRPYYINIYNNKG